MKHRRLFVLTTLVAASVAFSACSILASKTEYAAYRQIRLADSEQDKLVAMYNYMNSHPLGMWSKKIQAERIAAEPAVWESSRSSLAGLQSYLSAFPDGPHAAEAAPRLAALQAVQGRRQDEAAAAREVENQRREALAEQRRTWMTRAATFWTRTMIGITNWGRPIPQVARRNPEFSRAFGASPPPRCSREECIKFYRSDFAIPVPGSTRMERSLEMFLRLRMNGGNVYRAELLLPNKGFSRWYEQENRTLVIDEDPESRQAAINWAIERIMPAIREVAPGADQIMVVPEPIDPPTVRAPNQPAAGAAMAPGDPEQEEQEQQAAAPEPEQQAQEGGGGAGDLADLMAQVTGDDGTPAQPEAQPEAVPEAEGESMVLPIALDGFKTGNVRIVLFAAADEDYGTGYDGLFIEYEAPAAAAPQQRRRRRGRRR